MDAGEVFLATLMDAGQGFLVDTHKAEDCLMDISRMSLVNDRLEAELTLLAVIHYGFLLTTGN